jgi:hypothetical protein
MPSNDPRLDQLVDGELSEPERRDLLAGLDSQPGGWRRCALAFLEAQCWKQEFGSMVGREAGAATAPTADLRAPSPLGRGAGDKGAARSLWPGRLATVAAMAASFLLALWLGATAQQLFGPGHVPVPEAPTTNSLAGITGGGNPMAAPAKAAEGLWRLVRISSPSKAQDPGLSFDLPAVERENVDEQWLRSLPRAIPDNVVEALHRTGHQVQQRRELVPIPLDDGRQVVVPVDQVEVDYEGPAAY